MYRNLMTEQKIWLFFAPSLETYLFSCLFLCGKKHFISLERLIIPEKASKSPKKKIIGGCFIIIRFFFCVYDGYVAMFSFCLLVNECSEYFYVFFLADISLRLLQVSTCNVLGLIYSTVATVAFEGCKFRACWELGTGKRCQDFWFLSAVPEQWNRGCGSWVRCSYQHAAWFGESGQCLGGYRQNGQRVGEFRLPQWPCQQVCTISMFVDDTS